MLLPILVLGVLVLAPFVLVSRSSPRSEEAKQAAAKRDVATIASALDQFKLDVGRYPTASEGIAALVHPPASQPRGRYLKRLLHDPWNEPYVYKVTGNGCTVTSTGKDGVLNTDDDIAATRG